jgi:nicotinate-nucleotide adenylyltransferase
VQLGLLGGSFDPPHTGHLLIAQDAIDALALDLLLVIPAAQQPLKGREQTPPEHRLAMVRACFDGVPRVEVDPVEIARGGLSYMVDTVEAVRRRWPLAHLHRLLGMVRLVVLHRDTAGAVPLEQEIHGAQSVRWLSTRRVDVSSTEIRARVRDGRSLKGFVPESVATYIASTRLYHENSRTADRADG